MASTCSVRPSCSSAPPCPTTAIAKQVMITAAIESSAAIMVSSTAPRAADALDHVPGARASRAGRRCWARSTRARCPSTPTATVQRDQHRGVQPQAERDRVGEPRRAGRRSGSRRDHPGAEVTARRGAPGPRRPGATTVTTYSSSTHQRGSDQARSWVDQPNGESQLSHDDRGVPDGAQQEQHADAAARDGRAGARARGELAGDGGEHRWRPGRSRPRRRRTAAIRPTGSPPAMFAERCQQPDGHGDDRAERDGSGEGRVAADRRAAEQLGLAGLLLGARVPAYDDEQHAAPRRRRTARSSWSSPARRRCARRGSGRRARPPTGSR